MNLTARSTFLHDALNQFEVLTVPAPLQVGNLNLAILRHWLAIVDVLIVPHLQFLSPLLQKNTRRRHLGQIYFLIRLWIILDSYIYAVR